MILVKKTKNKPLAKMLSEFKKKVRENSILLEL